LTREKDTTGKQKWETVSTLQKFNMAGGEGSRTRSEMCPRLKDMDVEKMDISLRYKT
jgi:hypothetical protein